MLENWENHQLFTGAFLAFSLIFLTSLWLKYGSRLQKQDHENCGSCPVHKHQSNAPKEQSDAPEQQSNGPQRDIHLFAKTVESRPNDEVVIEQAFGISEQMVKSAIQHVSDEVKLRLYGLYKQSTQGDCTRDEPSKLSMADHAKWSAWTHHKGKPQIAAKREYFQTAYKEIAVAFNLNVLVFENAAEIPEELKQQAVASQQAPNINFNVQSKFEDEQFDAALHGDPDELFNKFDLTQSNVDIDAIKRFIKSNKCDLNKRNENGTVCTLLYLSGASSV